MLHGKDIIDISQNISFWKTLYEFYIFVYTTEFFCTGTEILTTVKIQIGNKLFAKQYTNEKKCSSVLQNCNLWKDFPVGLVFILL